MVDWLLSLSSAIRWALLALGIAAFLFVWEGTGMLSQWTKGHPKRQKVCFWVGILILAFILALGIIWLTHPTFDQTAQTIGDIQNTLQQMQKTLQRIEEALQ